MYDVCMSLHCIGQRLMFITLGRIGDKNSCLILNLTTVYQIKQVPFCSWLKIIKIMNGN